MEEQLANLKEIALPEPVPYTPQTIGWYLLLGLVLIAIAFLIVRWRQHVRRNRYRQEALLCLDEIETARLPLSELPVLVKRVVLAFTPREEVAGLSGDEFLKFLDSTIGSKDFSTGPGRLLPQLSYRAPESIEKATDAEQQALLSLIRKWIRGHRAGI